MSTELPECNQRKAIKLVKGPENRTHEERLREMVSLKRRSLKVELISLYNYLKGGCSEDAAGLCSEMISDMM